ncbi:hypothetical protein GCM10018780_15050 [Streptomyces lanatus]|nr:hypothetical protein GCM10018780_15050 [Streptomyces lanatus]
MTMSRIWTRGVRPVSGMLVTAAASPSQCECQCGYGPGPGHGYDRGPEYGYEYEHDCVRSTDERPARTAQFLPDSPVRVNSPVLTAA